MPLPRSPVTYYGISRRCLPLLVLLSACHSWTGYRGDPYAAIARATPARVRVASLDGQSVILHGPRVINDSIVGINDRGDRVALPKSAVAEVETRRFDAGKTFLSTISVAAVAVGGLWLAFSRSNLRSR